MKWTSIATSLKKEKFEERKCLRNDLSSEKSFPTSNPAKKFCLTYRNI